MPTRIESRKLLAASLVLIAGCGGPRPCIVTGKVLVDGRPAEGVYLVFYSAAGPPGRADSGTARSGGDGSFSLAVSTPGETIVTAFWPTVTVKGVETIEGPDRFGGLYRDAARPVATATIQEGENKLPPIAMNTPARGRARTRHAG